jgi:hypothetical protein
MYVIVICIIPNGELMENIENILRKHFDWLTEVLNSKALACRAIAHVTTDASMYLAAQVTNEGAQSSAEDLTDMMTLAIEMAVAMNKLTYKSVQPPEIPLSDLGVN